MTPDAHAAPASAPSRPIPSAADLDARDPLARFRELFVQADDVVAYLDGNSLGRPTVASVDRIAAFVRDGWGGRLIRGWDEEWLEMPTRIGDDLGRIAYGAAAGQTFVGDSTTVILYKLVRAAVRARPGRDELVIDTDNFPTDRFVLEGVAEECGMTIRWIEVSPDAGVTPELVAEAVGERTALVVLSQVAYRSGFLADVPGITRVVHDAGALVLWDTCHSVGVVPTELDAWGVDLAVGCSYKYLDGGPGAPAHGYVRSGLQAELRQPIQGWMGAQDVFAMGPEYVPADGIRRFLSGTPPIVGMLAMRDMLALIEEAGMEAIRAKSLALTGFALDLVDRDLVPLGARVASPREEDRRGSHVSVDHPRFRDIVGALWAEGVIPDFRAPSGLRLGLSPLTTSFREVEVGVEAIRRHLAG
ncbi:aminotransferase class V-fold PLP-dependent enzyme [Clavibacter capsici]|uniref:kynureninase n=1 Tax=Clavibacter capsici TaxID=1874630 RepID=UPI001428245B|nr:aminotransferase class V-fold PLP-dependent enzyme [Clavibacter capsici]QIS40995.1 aminotransferase class V-fold PLP-dependent enzyme [Clavibacter capsici]